MKMSEKEKNKQLNKEALLTIGLYVIFFIWWYAFGYGLSGGDPSNYTYILGLPSWFFVSCVLGWLLVSFAVVVMVKKFFVEIDLDSDEIENNEN